MVVNLLTREQSRFKCGEVMALYFMNFRAHLLHVLFIYYVPLNQIVVHYACLPVFALIIVSIAHLVFYLVFIIFLCFLVSTGVLEQPRTKHDERTKDGFNTESARGQT